MRQSTRQLFLSRGAGLFDALIALAILSFGLLAITRFQGRMVAQTTETQSRQTASQLAGELLSTVLVDVGSAACYTLPQSGSCTNSAAVARTSEWATRVAASLPGTVTRSATLTPATGRFQVLITWTGKETNDQHTLDVTTDVRP